IVVVPSVDVRASGGRRAGLRGGLVVLEREEARAAVVPRLVCARAPDSGGRIVRPGVRGLGAVVDAGRGIGALVVDGDRVVVPTVLVGCPRRGARLRLRRVVLQGQRGCGGVARLVLTCPAD